MLNEDYVLNDFSFTFAEILVALSDPTKKDQYLNRPFQFVDRFGMSIGKYMATQVIPEVEPVVQNYSGTLESGFPYGAMQMTAITRPLRFMDTAGKEPVPPAQ